MQKGELSKYKKDTSSTTMVTTSALKKTQYINVVFARVDTVTRGQRMKQNDENGENLEEIEPIFNLQIQFQGWNQHRNYREA